MTLRYAWSALLALLIAVPASAQAQLVINEVDSDTFGNTDRAEFVELYNAGNAAATLSDYVVVFFDGSSAGNRSYAAFDLSGTLAPGEFYVLGNPGVANVNQTFAANLLQNGPDAVALYTGAASSFPNGTSPTTTNLVDAVVYDALVDTSVPDDTDLLAALGRSTQYNENENGAKDVASIQRAPDGGTAFRAAFATPGAPNAFARVQIIHNAPDPDAKAIDIYINDTFVANDFAFRTGTPFVDLPAGVDLKIDVTAATATDNSAPLFTTTVAGGLDAAKAYQIIAAGVLDDTPANSADDTPDEFTLLVRDGAREAASSTDQVAIRAVHGSPDAPTVDIRARPSTVLFDDITYPAVTGYVEVAPGTYVLDVTTADGATVVKTVTADLSTGGRAVTVLASGFLDPSNDGAGAPGLELLAVFANGAAAVLPSRPVDTGDGPDDGRLALSVANPIRGAVSVAYTVAAPGEASVALYDMLGRRVALVASGPAEAGTRTATLDATALAAGVYVLRLSAGGEVLSRTVTVVR